jgi:hypothetical protein
MSRALTNPSKTASSRSCCELRIPTNWTDSAITCRIGVSIGGDLGIGKIALELLLMFGLFLWCEVAVDATTREVVNLSVFDPRASSGERVSLPKSKTPDTRPGRILVVDRFRLDTFVVPPYPNTRTGQAPPGDVSA